MNELIFLTHSLAIILFILLALRHSKMALFVLSSLLILSANLFVTKEITLFSLNVTASDSYAIGSILCNNLLYEFYGRKEMKKIIQINTAMLLFFAIIAFFHLQYIPSALDQTHNSFTLILSNTPRIFISSILCFFITQIFDAKLFTLFRKRFSLPLSIVLSMSIAQLFDTTLFTMLALSNIMHSLFSIIILSYAIKMITLALMAPFTKFAQLLKKGRSSHAL